MLSADERVAQKISSLCEVDKEYWSFIGRAKRAHCHGFIRYPAMMVPEMQGELIDIFVEHNPEMNSLFDPFVGSGTTMGEALLRGLNFRGIDINPLAILACEAKSDAFYLPSLDDKIWELNHRIVWDSSEKVDVDFTNIDKWFIKRVQIELSRIRRAIVSEPSKWARRFFWVAFCDTVRDVCNSRSSTYKLHVKDKSDIEKTSSCYEIFQNKVDANFDLKKEQMELLESSEKLSRHSFESNVKLSISDIRKKPRKGEFEQHDLMVTSPPYGDNATTVPYGQYSYLPLKWIDTDDLRNKFSSSLLETTASIDYASLGGSKKDALAGLDRLQNLSKGFSDTLHVLNKQAGTSAKRFCAFIKDLDKSLDNMLYRMKPNGYMVWTLGNRNMAGYEIPLNQILKELLEARKCKFVIEIDRNIPSKRMPNRNRSSKTMNEEKILIMKKLQRKD